MTFRLHPLACSLSAIMTLTLAACGGGGGDSTPAEAAAAPTPAVNSAPGTPPATEPAPAATPALPMLVTLTGSVMGNQAIRNAVVCVDLNANSACDPDEPASARTGADGAYTMTYDANKVPAAQLAVASLIAPMVPGAATDAATTIDAAQPDAANTTRPYVLRQVAGKAGQINPLTTLVAKGVADGMTEAQARSAVATQLSIAAQEIDDYQSSAPTSQARVEHTPRWIAQMAKGALEAGVTLRVGDTAAALDATAGDLAALRYTDASNYFVRTFPRQPKAAGAPLAQEVDARSGKTAGSDTDASTLYNFAYLTPAGWARCDTPWASAVGTPSYSNDCGASESVGYTVPVSIAGRTMASVVSDMQADPANVINTTTEVEPLLAALGGATFPEGSMINERHTMNLVSAIFINSLSSDARPESEATTLEQLVASKPAANVRGTAAGTLGVGLGSSTSRNLRVAFSGITGPNTGRVQFYECDLESTTGNAINCLPTAPGTYSIDTVNGVRVLRLAGHAETVTNNTRVFVEVQNAPSVATGSRVYQARETKMDLGNASSVQKRLNATAWAAMKAQLGL